MDLGLDETEVTSGIWAGLRPCPSLFGPGSDWWQWVIRNDDYRCSWDGGWLVLSTPYEPALIKAIKALHPRYREWRTEDRAWLISPHPTQLRYVVSDILKPFGFLVSSEVVEMIVRRKT